MNLNTMYKEELLNSIPVVSGMDIDIVSIEDQSISLSAPLDTNINYEGTAFGGSLNTLCILASYLLVHHSLKSAEVKFSSLVIQDSEIKYLKPVNEDFIATSKVTEKDQKLFLKFVQRKSVGRISVEAFIEDSKTSEEKVHFKGRFVASLEKE